MSREQPDGSIIFPARGNLPSNPPEGYIEDPNDERRWILLYCPCQYRKLNHQIPCPHSGRLITLDFCNKFRTKINPRICRDCPITDKI